MRTIGIGIFLVVALIQLSVPASVVWKRGRTLKHGRVWKFKTEPVDPVDAMRGRYVALRFAAERVPVADESAHERIPPDKSVYAALKEDANGFAEVDHISVEPISGENIIKVQAGYGYDHADHLIFPFDRFWVTEKNAPAAESAYRENSRRGKENAYVTVRVRDGDAALEQLYIDNQPLADYLRAHAPATK
jgi:uncharacterized membrane-anchored protein